MNRSTNSGPVLRVDAIEDSVEPAQRLARVGVQCDDFRSVASALPDSRIQRRTHRRRSSLRVVSDVIEMTNAFSAFGSRSVAHLLEHAEEDLLRQILDVVAGAERPPQHAEHHRGEPPPERARRPRIARDQRARQRRVVGLVQRRARQ